MRRPTTRLARFALRVVREVRLRRQGRLYAEAKGTERLGDAVQHCATLAATAFTAATGGSARPRPPVALDKGLVSTASPLIFVGNSYGRQKMTMRNDSLALALGGFACAGPEAARSSEAQLALLVAYKAAHGDCNVP